MGRFFCLSAMQKLYYRVIFWGGDVLCTAVPYARTSSRRKSSHAIRNIVPSQKMQLKANSP